MTGGAKSLKPDGYSLIRRGSDETLMSGAASYRPFRITAHGVLINGEVKCEKHGTEAKAIVRKVLVTPGTWCARHKSLVGDPKPVDLCVGRLKPLEREVEDRTGIDVQIIRITCV